METRIYTNKKSIYCTDVVNYINEHNLNVNIIVVDTEEKKNEMLNLGFKIVPTIYTNFRGSYQIYTGANKCMDILMEIYKQTQMGTGESTINDLDPFLYNTYNEPIKTVSINDELQYIENNDNKESVPWGLNFKQSDIPEKVLDIKNIYNGKKLKPVK